MDMDGLHWIPMDPIGFHSTNGYRGLPSKNISALSAFYLTSGTWKMYGKKSIPTFLFIYLFIFFFFFDV